MGFWEEIAGYTAEGLPVIGMPEDILCVHSIKNHIQQLINIRKGTEFLNPDMGIDEIPEVLIKVPPWIDDFSESLKSMVIKFDKRINDINLFGWFIEKRRLCLGCKIIVVWEKNRFIRYRVIFCGIGNNRVQIATGDED